MNELVILQVIGHVTQGCVIQTNQGSWLNGAQLADTGRLRYWPGTGRTVCCAASVESAECGLRGVCSDRGGAGFCWLQARDYTFAPPADHRPTPILLRAEARWLGNRQACNV
uniref:SFRICE_006416 n=1 Tax=Spodoptera frugiperda TaxID=7108 RepID=A0A2H1W226_SPOFR